MKKCYLNTSFMTKTAILGALAFVVMLFEVPLPFIAPVFYKIDFSEVIVLIGGFALGPLSAFVIEGIKILLFILFRGTQTAFVGEVANFIIGLSLVLPASYIYQNNKTFKSAIKSLIISGLLMTFVGFVMNYFFIIPSYVSIAKIPLDSIISMGNAIFPFIKNKFDLILFCTSPFNLIKVILDSLITILIYKKISILLKND